MAKLDTTSLNEYIAKLEEFRKNDVQSVLKTSVYEGAKVVADGISKELQTISSGKDTDTHSLTDDEKKDLINNFGISSMETNQNDTNVKLGFAGYGTKKTKKYPKGVPSALIARSVIAGTSFRAKNNFILRAVNRTKNTAINEMQKTLEENIEKKMEE